MHDDLRTLHRLGDAVTGAKIAPDPFDCWVMTDRTRKHPHPVPVPKDADEVSPQVAGPPCHEDGIHTQNSHPSECVSELAASVPESFRKSSRPCDELGQRCVRAPAAIIASRTSSGRGCTAYQRTNTFCVVIGHNQDDVRSLAAPGEL